jgi:hypothetical protein
VKPSTATTGSLMISMVMYLFEGEGREGLSCGTLSQEHAQKWAELKQDVARHTDLSYLGAVRAIQQEGQWLVMALLQQHTTPIQPAWVRVTEMKWQ